MADWSNLTNDVLEHLTSFFTLPDHNRFSAVCHNWRLVAKQKRHRPVEELPWLVLGEDEKTKKRNFYNLSEKRHYSIDIPELYGQFVCGSSYGWLFLVDEKINGRLLNPFTRESYELPPYPPPTDYEISITAEPCFSSDGVRIGWTPKELQMILVHKAVLSHDPRKRSNFAAMILFGTCPRLAMWRPGDKSWKVIVDPRIPETCFSDLICYKGKFFVINDFFIYIVRRRSDPKLRRLKPKIRNLSRGVGSYLVDWNGIALVVVQRVKKNMVDDGQKGAVPASEPKDKFLVVLVNLDSVDQSTVKHMNKYALFLGKNSAVVVDSEKFAGCIGSGIYFADTCENDEFIEYGHDFGVYDMVNKTVDKTMGRCLPGDENGVLHPPNAAIIWFTPSP